MRKCLVKIDLLANLYGIFLISGCYEKAQLTLGGVMPGQVVLDSIGKQKKPRGASKLAAFLHGLCFQFLP